MAANPLPLLALAAGAYFLVKKSYGSDSSGSAAEPETPETPADPAPDPNIADDDAGTPAPADEIVRQGTVNTVSWGKMPWEARTSSSPGKFKLALYDLGEGDLQVVEASGSPRLFSSAGEAEGFASSFVRAFVDANEVVHKAQFESLKSGSSPVHFSPSTDGATLIIENIDPSWTYEIRGPVGSEVSDFAGAEIVHFAQGGGTHLAVRSTGLSSAGDVRVEGIPSTGPSNDRRPLAVL
jgi:hypothetical protein